MEQKKINLKKDFIFNDLLFNKYLNKNMSNGQKSFIEKIFYSFIIRFKKLNFFFSRFINFKFLFLNILCLMKPRLGVNDYSFKKKKMKKAIIRLSPKYINIFKKFSLTLT
jgi:hypothetical protein